MRLIIGIDIGNSQTKVKIGNQTSYTFRNHDLLINDFSQLASSQSIKHDMVLLSISSVINNNLCEQIIYKILKIFKFSKYKLKIWDTQEIISLANLTNTEDLARLGSDRALKLYYLSKTCSQHNAISIGCGTAYTIDILEGKKLAECLIIPGLSMQLHSLAEKTAKLPLIEIDKIKQILAQGSRLSNPYAIVHGILASYREIFNSLHGKYCPQQTVCSGGYADLVFDQALTSAKNINLVANLEASILVELGEKV